MAAQGTAPVSVDNLAKVVEKIGGVGQLETLWTGKSTSASVPGVSGYDIVFVAMGETLSSTLSCMITLLPGLSDKNTVNVYSNTYGAVVIGDAVEAVGNVQVGEPAVMGVYGIRLGGGQLVADLLDLLREVG